MNFSNKIYVKYTICLNPNPKYYVFKPLKMKTVINNFILQLVDLPGYIMNLLPGQPENTAMDIERLARKYISR